MRGTTSNEVIWAEALFYDFGSWPMALHITPVMDPENPDSILPPMCKGID